MCFQGQRDPFCKNIKEDSGWGGLLVCDWAKILIGINKVKHSPFDFFYTLSLLTQALKSFKNHSDFTITKKTIDGRRISDNKKAI